MRIDRGQIEGAGEGEEYSSIKAYRPLERYPETLFCHPQRRSSTENPIAGLTFKNNSLEISFSNDLIGGDYTILLDNNEFPVKLQEGRNSTFVTMDFAGMGKHKIEIFGTTYLDIINLKDVIDYEIDDGYVKEIEDNQSTNSLIFTLYDPGDNGKISITLSDDVIIPFDDGSFIVMIDGIESNYIIDDGVLDIDFNSDNETIEIIGTYVIPEFYEIAPLVLATSLIVLIVLRKHKKLFA